MDLRLTSEDQRLFASALQALLSPLAHANGDAWRSEAARAVKALLRAETSSFVLPVETGVPFYSEDLPAGALDEYLRYYHAVDVGVSMVEELGLDVYGTRAMPPEHWQRYRQSEVCNDFYRRHGMKSSVGMIARVPGVAALSVHSPREPHPYLGERGVALARMLLPAFRSGVASLLHTAVAAHEVAERVDGLAQGAFVFDLAGAVLHRNPALGALMATEPEGLLVEQAAADVFRALRLVFGAKGPGGVEAARSASGREVRTAGAAYRLRGSFLGETGGANAPLLLVTVERTGSGAAIEESLRRRFGLTRQECRVAMLLAQRRRNDEIAAALSISVHTARHHTESVLVKLGVHSRDAVAARITA